MFRLPILINPQIEKNLPGFCSLPKLKATEFINGLMTFQLGTTLSLFLAQVGQCPKKKFDGAQR